jgi:transcriptional regulator with XRE-family HTH domain
MDAHEQGVVIGHRLAQIRERRRLSQSSVALQFGHPQSWLAKIELGERRLLYHEGIALLEFYMAPLDILDPDASEREFRAILDRLGDEHPDEPHYGWSRESR